LQISRNAGNIALIIPRAPSDLLVGTTGSAWVAVQGDITQPLVHTMSNARTVAYPHGGAQTTDGVAFISKFSISLTNDGAEFQDIDSQLDRRGDHLLARTLSYMDDTLLAGYGYTFDLITKSWYRQSELFTGASIISTATGQANTLIAAYGGASPQLALYQGPYGAIGSTVRRNAYTWKSVPFHRDDGRQVRVREVQCFVETYDSNATVAVTVNGATRTVTIPTAGRQVTKHLFLEQDETLDVQIVSTAGNSANEAPFLERHRVGHQAGHLLGL